MKNHPFPEKFRNLEIDFNVAFGVTDRNRKTEHRPSSVFLHE